MVFKGKKEYGILRGFILFICCLVALSFTACTKKSDKGNIDENKNGNNIKEEKYLKAVFERNNNIYIYDEKAEGLQLIGDTVKFKELMVLSPDKKNVAFKYFYESNSNPIEVIIYNINSREYSKILIEDKELENIIELKWISKDRVLITSALNPSVLKYGIYDINSKKQVNGVKGLLMDVFKEGEQLLYSKTSRKKEDKSNLYLGDKLLYELESNDEEVHFAKISQDNTNIAFRTLSYNIAKNEVKEFLYTGKVDIEKSSVSEIKKVPIPVNIMGELSFDKNNNLFIIGDENTYKVEGSFFTLIENQIKDKFIPPEEKLTKFKQVLKKTFVDEFIEDYLQLDELQIYNIQWF